MTSKFLLAGIEAYKSLFWPKFTEYDGCVFLAFDQDVYTQWARQTNSDKPRIEAVMNHRHIVDLLPSTVEDTTRELVLNFGDLLREVWEAKLLHDFPGRHFKVTF